MNNRAGRQAVALVTLGCAKNQVDSEVMLGLLKGKGYALTADLNRAAIVIVNTCGFLGSAVTESVDRILEIAELKKKGALKKLVVTGCLVARYGAQLESCLPEVDCFVPLVSIDSIAAAVQGSSRKKLKFEAGRPKTADHGSAPFLYDHTYSRVLGNAGHWAYVKIGEGCNRRCSFCLIPKLRGRLRSREFGSVLQEIEDLGAAGVKEVNLVAQDTTSFGRERVKAGAPGVLPLVRLLSAIDQSKAVPWVRLLYAFPSAVSGELLDAMGALPSVCEYLDLPLQHCSLGMLKTMRRPLGRFAARPVVEFIRRRAPQIYLRTTFLVGYPGETEKDVRELESFILEGHFLHVGIFTFSAEEGTPAAKLPDRIPPGEKNRRRARLMRAQQKIVKQRLSGLIGSRQQVLLEGAHPQSGLLLQARSRFQAPEVDGSVIINDIQGKGDKLKTGSLAEVEITAAAGYDLVATLKRGINV